MRRVRRPRRGTRRYGQRKLRERVVPRRTGSAIVMLCLAGVLVLSSVKVVSYVSDYFASRRASKELRDAYYLDIDEADEFPEVLDIAAIDPETANMIEPEAAPAQTAGPQAAATQEPAAVAVQETDTDKLVPLGYPGNPLRSISSRFEKIRRQNKDIIGWLTVEDLLDEAVVQRDNSYYLRRDYQGYHNVNGAIFLDESISLESRPYTLMLYGHNMKTGAMFGSLRNYEDIGFYKKAPFITFDTMYENGRYVIFSVATVSLKRGNRHYVDLAKLNSTSRSRREEAISELLAASLYSCEIRMSPDDQLLLLVTCVDDDDERRIVAARRVRESETEETLRKRVGESHRK